MARTPLKFKGCFTISAIPLVVAGLLRTISRAAPVRARIPRCPTRDAADAEEARHGRRGTRHRVRAVGGDVHGLAGCQHVILGVEAHPDASL